jgi:hypothetical protein
MEATAGPVAVNNNFPWDQYVPIIRQTSEEMVRAAGEYDLALVPKLANLPRPN